MPTTFVDGPAKGVSLMLRRAPIMLRVVRDAAGAWDALDQLGDVPRRGEQVFLYQLTGPAGHVHIRVRGGKGGGCYSTGEYALWPTPPSDEILRDTQQWHRWCDLLKEELLPDWAEGRVVIEHESEGLGAEQPKESDHHG